MVPITAGTKQVGQPAVVLYTSCVVCIMDEFWIRTTPRSIVVLSLMLIIHEISIALISIMLSKILIYIILFIIPINIIKRMLMIITQKSSD